MSTSDIFVAVLIVGTLLIGVGLLVAGLFEKQHEATELQNMSRRMQRVAGGAPEAQKEVDKAFAREEERRFTGKNRSRNTTYLPSLSGLHKNYNWLARMEDDLIQSRSPWRATELIAASILLSIATCVLLLLFHFGIFSVFALVILFTPWLYVKAKRAAFYRKFDDQLGDALMLMSNSLRAGFSFMQSMEMVGKEAPPPISEEFTRVTQEIAIGVPVTEALLGMAERIKSMDLNLVVTAVIIQREVGGALAQLLELIAGVIRERQRIRGEIRTLTAQGRLTGYILGCLPFIVGFLIYFVGRLTAPNDPSFIDPLISTSLGHLILLGAFIWQMIGFWLIMRIVNIKV
jgi:tight adherence protein B